MSGQSLKTLSGKWRMSKDSSSDVGKTLAIQGFGKMMQTAVSAAPVDIYVTQKGDGEDGVEIKQTTTASIPGITEQWVHDWEFREFDDLLFGKLKSRSRWAKPKDVDDAFLNRDLDADEDVVLAEVQSLEHGWLARQLWCFEGEHFVRRVITTKDGDEAQTKLVYELRQ